MNLKLLHTGDVHLGMRFSRYAVQDQLCEARFTSLEKLVQKANDEKCDLFVVAGDLFDNVRISKGDIVRGAQILSKFEGALCLVLPGNHDYYTGQPDGLWATFRQAAGERVLLLTDQTPVNLDPFGVNAIIYPAPCSQKHSKTNGIGWVASAPKRPVSAFHIGLAHGSMGGLSYDKQGEYYPMTEAELLNAGVDLWLLGHVHLRYPLNPGKHDRIYYSGTPEPDGMDCAHEGNAWIIELNEDKEVRASAVAVNTYRFIDHNAKIRTLEELNSTLQKLDDGNLRNTILRLEIGGYLSAQEMAELSELIENTRKKTLHLEVQKSGLTLALTAAQIKQEFTEDSLPFRILQSLTLNDDDKEALQAAYEIIKEEAE